MIRHTANHPAPRRSPATAAARGGLTLLEISIGFVIGSLLFIAVTRLFSGSLQMTRRGSDHLTNIQAAGLLITQIEQDITHAVSFGPPSTADADPTLTASVVTDFGGGGDLGISEIAYEPGANGLGCRRTVTSPGSPPKQRLLAADRLVRVTWERVTLTTGARTGFLVDVTVSSPPKGTEPERIRRFVFPQNAFQSRQNSGWTF